MTKTEKAETAAEDATGITTANVEPTTDSSPADTEIESPAPPAIPEIATDEPYFWRKITDDDVCSAIYGTYLYSIVFDLAKNYKGDIPFQLILHQALSVFLPALTHRKDEDNEPQKTRSCRTMFLWRKWRTRCPRTCRGSTLIRFTATFRTFILW